MLSQRAVSEAAMKRGRNDVHAVRNAARVGLEAPGRQAAGPGAHVGGAAEEVDRSCERGRRAAVSSDMALWWCGTAIVE